MLSSRDPKRSHIVIQYMNDRKVGSIVHSMPGMHVIIARLPRMNVIGLACNFRFYIKITVQIAHVAWPL